MFKKMLFAMPLVLVLALVVSVSTLAQGKVALSDAQMSSIYGGVPCYVIETGDTACADLEQSGTCTDIAADPNVPDDGWEGEGCDGDWNTSCLQSEKYCKQNQFPNKGCIDDSDIDCEGTYDHCSCGERPECDFNCDWYLCSGRTPGEKSDAHDRW